MSILFIYFSISICCFFYWKSNSFRKRYKSILWILPKSFHPFPLKAERESSLHSNKYLIKTIISLKYCPNLSADSLYSLMIQKIKKISLKNKKKSQSKNNYQDVVHPKTYQIPNQFHLNVQWVKFQSKQFQADKSQIYHTLQQKVGQFFK